jgi:hypothetical protein
LLTGSMDLNRWRSCFGNLSPSWLFARIGNIRNQGDCPRLAKVDAGEPQPICWPSKTCLEDRRRPQAREPVGDAEGGRRHALLGESRQHRIEPHVNFALCHDMESEVCCSGRETLPLKLDPHRFQAPHAGPRRSNLHRDSQAQVGRYGVPNVTRRGLAVGWFSRGIRRIS